MGFDLNLGGSPSSSSPSSKRTRDPEEEVYVDNLRSHKRYLSEVQHLCLIYLLSCYCCFSYFILKNLTLP